MNSARLDCLPVSTQAEAIAAALAGAEALSPTCESIHVPYFWYRAAGSAPTPYGRRPFGIDCLVDARNGEASTSDPFALLEKTHPKGNVLRQRVPLRVAQKAAQRCVSNALCRKLRTLADFRLELAARGVVHKTFWVVPSGDELVLVDSVTGGWYPMTSRPMSATA